MQIKHLIEWFLDMDKLLDHDQANVANGRPVTIEAEYNLPGDDDVITEQWTFYQKTPSQAKELVETHLVPIEATLWRLGVWYGTFEKRPEGGHESGILDDC